MGDSRYEWTKPTAVIISLAALGATGSSAVAAWQSWRTAEASLAVAEENVKASGAVLYVDSSATLHGDCQQDEQLSVEVTIGNPGRLPTDVETISVYMQYKDAGGQLHTLDSAWNGEDVEIPPQRAESFQMSFSCMDLASQGYSANPNDLARAVRSEEVFMVVEYEAENDTHRPFVFIRDVAVS